MLSFVFVLALCCLCSANMDIYYLKEASLTKGAVCLDGSPSIYYFKPGSKTNSSKWVLHLIGGGMCLSDEECLLRSQGFLGSSVPWPPEMAWGGPIDENSTYNPDFYDWSHVLFVYCDGASFAGDVEEPAKVNNTLLYYRGHRILQATIKDLLENRGLDQATEVLLVGDSAGAMAVYYHADEIKSMMPKSVTRFKAIPFSGIFLDHPNAEGKMVFTNNMKHLFNLHNYTGGVNQKCIAAQPSVDERAKCIFGHYSMPYIETPLFVMGSAYDSVGTACIVGAEPILYAVNTGVGNCSAVPGWASCEEDPSQCTAEQWEKIEEYGEHFMAVVENNPKFIQNGNGLFEYNCHSHDIECNLAWERIIVKGTLMRDAVRKWYFSDNEPSSNHFYKDCVNHGSYTCNPTCSLPYNINAN